MSVNIDQQMVQFVVTKDIQLVANRNYLLREVVLIYSEQIKAWKGSYNVFH